MNRPLCKCHGVPMIPRKDRTWRCRIKQREYSRRWYHRNTDHAKAIAANVKMRLRGDRGAWMGVLRVTKVTEVEDV